MYAKGLRIIQFWIIKVLWMSTPDSVGIKVFTLFFCKNARTMKKCPLICTWIASRPSPSFDWWVCLVSTFSRIYLGPTRDPDKKSLKWNYDIFYFLYYYQRLGNLIEEKEIPEENIETTEKRILNLVMIFMCKLGKIVKIYPPRGFIQ